LSKKSSSAATFVAIAAAAALLITGCSSNAGSTAASAPSAKSTEPVTLHMVWWGNDVRAKATLDAIKGFEQKHPNITVETQTLPFAGYFDKLSTQIAANDAPDVQQLQGVNMVQYASQGALLNLTKVGISNLDPGTTKAGKISGKQIGVPTGLSTLAVIANPTLFKRAGVAMPDDKTWTWSDYDKLAAKITANTSKQVRGAKSSGWDITEMATWAAQRGHQLFTSDGKLGAKQDDFASLFSLAKKMMDDGASPSASESSEQLTLAAEQSGVATGRYAMQLDAASNFPAVSNASKDPLKLLRLPSASGKSGDSKMMYVASQYWGASARTAHPVESQMLIDYLSNSIDAGKILGVTRGTPANAKVRDAILPTLAETDKDVVKFMGDISTEVVPSRLAPAGAASFTANFQRYASEVLFGRQTPNEAAKNLIAETNSALMG
jgi:multiple sugar transport system substrate-binding protein